MTRFRDPADLGGTRGDGGADAPEVWEGRATNRFQWLLAVGGLACLALGVKLAVDFAWSGSAAPLIMAIVGCIAAGLLVLAGTLSFVYVVVTVDRDGLSVRCGHMGVPRRHIPWDEVHGVTLARCTPRHWGGWGYRWRPHRGTAVVVRQGPAVVLELGHGHLFTVTVDDAEGAVRVISERLRALSETRRTA